MNRAAGAVDWTVMFDLSPVVALWLGFVCLLSTSLFVAGRRLRTRESTPHTEGEEWASLLQNETLQVHALHAGTLQSEAQIRAAGSRAAGRPVTRVAAGRSPIR